MEFGDELKNIIKQRNRYLKFQSLLLWNLVMNSLISIYELPLVVVSILVIMEFGDEHTSGIHQAQ